MHAAPKGYVDDEIEKVENSIDNLGDTFMPKAGGSFTGAVKYSNVNDNGGSSLTLMHKDAFSSVLTNFQMGRPPISRNPLQQGLISRLPICRAEVVKLVHKRPRPEGHQQRFADHVLCVWSGRQGHSRQVGVSLHGVREQ